MPLRHQGGASPSFQGPRWPRPGEIHRRQEAIHVRLPDYQRITRPKLIDDFLAPLSDDLEQALYASKIISYAQGYMLMREAAKEYKWDLNVSRRNRPSSPLFILC
jgi:hypothetical protein